MKRTYVAIAALCLALTGVSAPRVAGAAAISGVSDIGFTVADMNRAVTFYTKILGFKTIAAGEESGPAFEHLVNLFGARARTVQLRLGSESIELVQYLAPSGRPLPSDAASNDKTFEHLSIITSDMQRAYALLRRNGVRFASSGPQRLPDSNPDAGGIRAFYFRDPDGHFLETLQFPPGKGDPRWHPASAHPPLFLGIDHSAIVTGNTDADLAFYRDILGFHVAGTSENFGTEQEHLNNVFGARLRITTLRADSGTGIELLEYISPRGGRPMPDDVRASDIVHWTIRCAASDIDTLSTQLRAAHVQFVSPGIVDGGGPRGVRALRFADPDGHTIEVDGAR